MARKSAYAPASSPLTERLVELPLRADGGLRLGVIADTHSQPHPATEGHLRAMQPDAILHAGDIGDLSVLDTFAAIAPLVAVRGNIDGHGPTIPDLTTIDLTAGGQLALRLLLMHIAVAGPRIRADAARLAAAREAQVVVCGHSHVPFIGRDRGLTVFNPGSIGPRRFQLPIVFGVLEIEGGKLSMRHHSCATGEVWAP